MKQRVKYDWRVEAVTQPGKKRAFVQHPRQRRIVELHAAGVDYDDIAAEMGVSAGHIKQILREITRCEKELMEYSLQVALGFMREIVTLHHKHPGALDKLPMFGEMPPEAMQ